MDPGRFFDLSDARVAQYAAFAGIPLPEARLRMGAMADICQAMLAAVVSERPAQVDRFGAFELPAVLDAATEERIGHIAQTAMVMVDMLVLTPAPGFDVAAHAREVAAAFGQPDWRPGRDLDLTAIPPAWWQTALGRLCARVLRNDG